MSICQLKVNLTQGECDTVDRACVRETGRTGALVNRSDLVRIWVAAGCPTQAEAATGLPVSKASLFTAMDGIAEGQPPDEEEDGGAAPPIENFEEGMKDVIGSMGDAAKAMKAERIQTPEQAKAAAELAAARAGRTPIPKPGEKKSP